MWPFFDQALARYRDLEQQLSDPAVIADHQRYSRSAKEHRALARKVKPYLEHRQVTADLAQGEEMLRGEADPEMRLYAEQDCPLPREREQALRARVEQLLLGE